MLSRLLKVIKDNLGPTKDAPHDPIMTAGDYDLVELVGVGSMGTVYKARHRLSGETVAVKVLPPHLATHPVILKRFEREFRAASKLSHPNIVRALDFGEEGPSPYLVMEFVEGESLGDRLDRDKRIPEAEAIRLIVEVCKGLQAAHNEGLIHRDVKPDNILITPEGQVKITDLGLVKEQESEANLTRTGRGLGTPHFMAPDQWDDAKNADHRSDIYSLGATLYMMVTGELPFKDSGPWDIWAKKVKNDLPPARQVNPEVSERTELAIRKAMNIKAADRFGSIAEFLLALTGSVDCLKKKTSQILTRPAIPANPDPD